MAPQAVSASRPGGIAAPWEDNFYLNLHEWTPIWGALAAAPWGVSVSREGTKRPRPSVRAAFGFSAVRVYQAAEKGGAVAATAPISKVRGEDLAHSRLKFGVACGVGAVLVM